MWGVWGRISRVYLDEVDIIRDSIDDEVLIGILAGGSAIRQCYYAWTHVEM